MTSVMTSPNSVTHPRLIWLQPTVAQVGILEHWNTTMDLFNTRIKSPVRDWQVSGFTIEVEGKQRRTKSARRSWLALWHQVEFVPDVFNRVWFAVIFQTDDMYVCLPGRYFWIVEASFLSACAYHVIYRMYVPPYWYSISE